jgi:hypothetical protein
MGRLQLIFNKINFLHTQVIYRLGTNIVAYNEKQLSYLTGRGNAAVLNKVNYGLDIAN